MFEFDSKAQRKIVEGEAIVMLVENGSATDGLEYILMLRVLFMLH